MIQIFEEKNMSYFINKNITFIIQARVGSSRLPNEVYSYFRGRSNFYRYGKPKEVTFIRSRWQTM